MRMIIASFLSLAVGWGAFALLLTSGYVVTPLAPEAAQALALGSAITTAAFMFVLAIVAAFVARGLSVALRVGPSWFSGQDPYGDDYDDSDDASDDEPLPEPAWAAPPRPAFAEGSVSRRLPRAEIVEDEPVNPLVEASVSDGVPHHAHSISPYSSTEMQFFAEGDEDRLS